jgi:uncharacterized protein (DUF1697 family)
MPNERAYVALLRGINVGGNHMLPMRELVPMFAELGCKEAAHYIQSGNVVLRATEAVAEKLPAALGKKIEAAYGFAVPITLRSSTELEDTVAKNPFAVEGADIKALYVAFLGAEPSAEKVAALDPNRSPPDAFAVIGRAIYLHFPSGNIARTKLSDAFFAKLGVTSTTRNWKTVHKLRAMTQALEELKPG